jgi:hypothetical protein
MGLTNQANGAGCLAAQMIAHFKVGVGNFYIVPLQEEDDYAHDYTYTIKVDRQLGGGNISITVHAYGDQIFEGSIQSFKEFVAEEVK